MKAIITSLSLLLAAAAVADERNYQVSSFDRIDASSAVTIQYTVGDKCGVRAEGRTQDIERYEVKTKGSCLVIRMKPNYGRSVRVEKTVFYVTGPADVREVELSGASKFVTSSTLSGDAISFDVSGASSVNCRAISAQQVEIDCSGASHFTASVKGGKLQVDCSGASSTKLDVQCDEVEADASGASKITLAGSARVVNTDTSGVSSINRKGLKRK